VRHPSFPNSLCAMALALACGHALADVSNLERGLPAQVTDAEPIGRGEKQVQLGSSFDRQRNRETQLTLEPQVQWGFADRWQASLSVRGIGGSADNTGSGDIGVQVFRKLSDEGTLLPALAAELQLALPSGKNTLGIPFASPLPFATGQAGGAVPGRLAHRRAGRAIAENLQATLKQPVVIDNKAGASTLLGAKHVANAPPDGYTLLLPTVTTMSMAPQLMSKPGIDPLKDLTPIARWAPPTSSCACTRRSRPAHEGLDRAVKKNPGKYSYASSGTGSPHHIFMELLKKQLGLDIVHVPYKGSSGAMVDLLSGKVDMAFLRRHAGHPNLQAGKLFTVGTSMAKRTVLMPGVPPIAEPCRATTGRAGSAFAGPPNMPQPVVHRWPTRSASCRRRRLRGHPEQGRDGAHRPHPARADAAVRAQRVPALGPGHQGLGRHRRLTPLSLRDPCKDTRSAASSPATTPAARPSSRWTASPPT
jgi:tripartite-type tricarboxylate transporter receptor subunit TctC